MEINVLSIYSKHKTKSLFKRHINLCVGNPGEIYQLEIYHSLHFFFSDLEKKIRDLNISRQEKADQLKQLEDQVIGIKNEIVEQENKYATCYT